MFVIGSRPFMFMTIQAGKNLIIIGLLMAIGTGSPGTAMFSRINGKKRFVLTKQGGGPGNHGMARFASPGKSLIGMNGIGGLRKILLMAIITLRRNRLESLGESIPMATETIQLLMPTY